MCKETKNPNIIKCPHCGWEYHPSEIFYPNAFFGRTDSLVKSPVGKILYVDYQEGEEPNFQEHFECEDCGKSFVINATVSYSTSKVSEEVDFSNPYVSLLD
ncbi:MAG: hypothetical protein J6A25_07850 [Lachnospiraceae bacterium]|nr:hypothetical protein [Lachnospiraceae bacterium]MBO5425412.1 hypothetical protein [Lachnospiraceae bacterium]